MVMSKRKKTLRQLAEAIGGKVRGDADCLVAGVATLDAAGGDDIAFLAHTKYRKLLAGTRAAAVIVRDEDAADCPKHALIVRDPYLAYAKVAALLYPQPATVPGVHPSAVIATSAKIDASAQIEAHCVVGAGCEIGAGVFIGPGSVLGENCRIGAHSRLLANVTICAETTLGSRCLVHPGAVLGSDGFGQANENGRWQKIPQLGRVTVGDDVEIGANTTIDRGALGDTRIEDGVKLDNLIQVAHNVVIGAHTAIAACVGIAGSTKIGRHCAIAGGVGIVGHLEIADGVTITAMTLVTKSIAEAGVYSSGTPLQENSAWHRNAVRMKQLDELAKRVKELEKKLSGLAGAAREQQGKVTPDE